MFQPSRRVARLAQAASFHVNRPLDMSKILRLQVTLDSPHAKNVSNSQTALSLFTYTHMKFLSFLTPRLSFCSTNVVKVQVS